MSEEKSMNDYENELERSFQVLREGDILDVTVIGVSDTEVTVDLNYYTEGIIPIEECSDDPSFSIKKDMIIGDVIQAMVLDPENASGNVILSRKEANRVLVWDELKEDMADGTVFDVKITEAVPAGVVGYVRGIRAFIPASQLALTYVEDTESYVGMTVQAVIITVEKDIQMLHDQIIYLSAIQGVQKVLFPLLHTAGIYGIHNSNFFIKDNIGIIRNSLRNNILAFKKIDGGVVHTNVLYGI